MCEDSSARKSSGMVLGSAPAQRSWVIISEVLVAVSAPFSLANAINGNDTACVGRLFGSTP